jgi:serine/threonine-protein kinase ATR
MRAFPRRQLLNQCTNHFPLTLPLLNVCFVHIPLMFKPLFDLEFYDEVEIMHSLARPRKITIRGSNGQTYMFLGKPKDDLRKDARLMDFNAIINKLLKANSESRRRQLRWCF